MIRIHDTERQIVSLRPLHQAQSIVKPARRMTAIATVLLSSAVSASTDDDAHVDGLRTLLVK